MLTRLFDALRSRATRRPGASGSSDEVVPPRAGAAPGSVDEETTAAALVEMARLEQLAEAAYEAMYEAPRRGAKDCYDDACGHLGNAIAAARRAGRTDEVDRLTNRREHIAAVFDRQFRHVG